MTLYLAVENLEDFPIEIVPFEKKEDAINYAKSKIADYILDCVNENDTDAAIRYIRQMNTECFDDSNIPFYVSIGKDEIYVEVTETK